MKRKIIDFDVALKSINVLFLICQASPERNLMLNMGFGLCSKVGDKKAIRPSEEIRKNYEIEIDKLMTKREEVEEVWEKFRR